MGNNTKHSNKNSNSSIKYDSKTLNKWTMWAHLPHDTNWTLESYKNIYTISTIGEGISLIECMSDTLVKNCMLFLMKEGITPVWEDKANRDGGCFSYKVLNKNVYQSWKELCYIILGGSISSDNKFVDSVNGITISPKKNFCIIKIWLSNCNHQNPNIITKSITEMNANTCMFKQHVPEY